MRLRVLALGALLLLGCGPEATEYRHSFPALGTLINIEIFDDDRDAAMRATGEIAAYLDEVGREWYAWGDGELAQANARLASGEPAELSAPLAKVLRRALNIRDRSHGYFDPTVGLLVEAWGFHDSTEQPTTPPPEDWLREWQGSAAERTGLTLTNGVVTAPVPVKLALGGIAKGTALAGAIGLLRINGITDALVEAGGDLQVIGKKGDRRWRIGIRDPRAPGVLGVVELESGEAILSSGDYERYFEIDGQRFHHLLDPHTGYPVGHTAGTTVIHTDPELADAAATALMAAGPELFDVLTDQLDIEFALLVTTDGEILMTPGMRTRLVSANRT